MKCIASEHFELAEVDPIILLCTQHKHVHVHVASLHASSAKAQFKYIMSYDGTMQRNGPASQQCCEAAFRSAVVT